MSNLIEAMKQALEALETEVSIDWTNNDEFNASAEKMHDAITSLRQAIVEAEKQVSYTGNGTAGRENTTAPTGFFFQMPKAEQEPVAWHESGAFGNVTTHKDWALANNWQPLYTHPQPKRDWVGLTYQERCELWNIASKFSPDSVIMHDFAKDIEQALKDKNT